MRVHIIRMDTHWSPVGCCGLGPRLVSPGNLWTPTEAPMGVHGSRVDARGSLGGVNGRPIIFQ